MFSRKKKTQQSTSTKTVTTYEIKDGKASFTKSTKTTENGKVIQKSTTSGDLPLRNLKDAVPFLAPTPTTSTYVSPYRNFSSTSTRLPSTTRIWELPKSQIAPKWEPSSATSLIKQWEARPVSTITAKQPPPPAKKTSKSKLKAGKVFILNHMKFNNAKNEYRIGSDRDVIELKKTFEKFNMAVAVKSDQTKRDIKQLMDKGE